MTISTYDCSVAWVWLCARITPASHLSIILWPAILLAWKMDTDKWEFSLHWSFRGERVLVPSIRLHSFATFLIASIFTVGVCIAERCAAAHSIGFSTFWHLLLDVSHSYWRSIGIQSLPGVHNGKKRLGRQCSIGWPSSWDCEQTFFSRYTDYLDVPAYRNYMLIAMTFHLG